MGRPYISTHAYCFPRRFTRRHSLPSQNLDLVLERVLLPLERLFVNHLDGVELARHVLALGQPHLREGATAKEERERYSMRWTLFHKLHKLPLFTRNFCTGGSDLGPFLRLMAPPCPGLSADQQR